MTLEQTLAALKKAGTAQNRKVYGRHGVQGEQYGVSFTELGKVEVDHGETSCKTPDAAGYIAKTLDHRARKTGTRKARA